MKNLVGAGALLVVIVLVSGCGGIGAALVDEEASSAGAQKIFPEETNVEEVNIFMLLDPSKPVNPNGCCAEDKKDPNEERFREVEEALEAFYTRTSDKPDSDKKLMRTRVQERIVAASNQRCENFKKKLQQYEGSVNFLFGALTTTLAGAGAITTATSTARILSGLAGISSVTRAEFNSDYFKNLSIEVVTKGLTARREVMFQTMRRNWNVSLNEYSVEAAIGDALDYHGACTVIAGLEEASDSISTVSDPGLTTLTRAFKAFGEARRALDGGVARATRGNVSPLTSYAQADKALQTLEREKSILTAAAVPTVREVSDPGIADDEKGKAKKPDTTI